MTLQPSLFDLLRDDDMRSAEHGADADRRIDPPADQDATPLHEPRREVHPHIPTDTDLDDWTDGFTMNDDETNRPSSRQRNPFVVEVVRSKRRKRTVGAQMLGGVLRVTVPSWMSRSEEEKWVEEMTRRYERAHRVGRIDLKSRAAALARRFDLPRPADVRWGGDMRTQWGSCTPVDRTIRLADRLAEMPPWVLDYVLVHEMAHIEVPNHSAAFWALVNRYDKAERAIGYLLAKSNEPGDTPDVDDDVLGTGR